MTVLLLSPLIGFLINGIQFRSHAGTRAGIIASFATALSFLAAIQIFMKLLSLPEETRHVVVNYFTWIAVENVKIDASFLVDAISGIMILIITGVGFLIHLFSIGYMGHDERPAKYFAYLNLFVFNMLLLVLGQNLLVMFVGWEGVGLCSYLLIGFWFTDPAKAAAGMKAFVTNRIGDAGLLLGGFLLFLLAGSFDFSAIETYAKSLSPEAWGPITVICLLLFVGATGKSAQIPLYVWLPDAMAGPTPVSALIHAATMVTAGVYMIVRMNALFLAAPTAMMVIAIIGGVTAVFAACIGFAQNDIKKVLAYSTVSQLGYMFLACGVGAFGAAMFHLMTHAFFKALMFLGSGSVIHAMHEEQDIRKMGGLRHHLPITHATFFCGWLAILGTPLFSGFFSKDEILWMSFHSPRGHWALWCLGVMGAGMTAFYMTRLMCLTFWGKSRVPSNVHPHESPWTMTVPLILLAILSVVGGWIGVPHVLGHSLHIPNFWEEWLSHSILPVPGIEEAKPWMEYLLMGVSVTVAGGMAYLAAAFYLFRPETAAVVSKKMGSFGQLVADKFRIDELYEKTIIGPLIDFSRGLWGYVDVGVVDRATYWLADWLRSTGDGLRSLQTGNLQMYAFYIMVGIVALLGFIFV